MALAANALLTSGDEQAKEYLLPGIAAGETIATLAFTEDSGRWDADGITLAAAALGRRVDAQRAQVVRGRRPRGRL